MFADQPHVDGWWFLMNHQAWGQIPPDLQTIFGLVTNDAAMIQRVQVAQQNTQLKGELAAKGLAFNDVDPAPFRALLSKAGFYQKRKERFGAEQWSLLEEYTGSLT